MKTLILAAILILSLATTGKSLAQSTTDIFTITVYESMDLGYNKILVYDNDKLVEEVRLEAFHYKQLGTHQIEINKILRKYGEAGYRIISELRGSVGLTSPANSAMVTTYRLEKKPN